MHGMTVHFMKQLNAFEMSDNAVDCAAMGDEELYEKLTAVKGIGMLLTPLSLQSDHRSVGTLS